MQRTTIMADEGILDQLREIAREERTSLAEVIRQALEWRAKQRRPRKLAFIGIGASKRPPYDVARRAGDMDFEPRSWR